MTSTLRQLLVIGALALIGFTGFTSSAAFASTSSPLIFNRTTGLYSGSIAISNTGSTAIAGPLLVDLSGLPASVVLQGAVSDQGMPSLAVSGGIAAGATISVPVSFANPFRVALSYAVRVFEGGMATASR